ncbi:hypothetical protein BK133_22470 [Paenibacillus sp. FSL H8-0548]|uniref:hypothetical protein n=1 Tax=Paenibacillus sp. FSL H8-0548 TaxID=1920422 RepID=UPI00096FD6AD|nr:hypothetical protein [Paenibacillus sp. FSL H8-0548]OMF24860.1 hypothetical protein BK133_22470 [Paenibacillus sp. FSL H8-0548]
MSEGLLRAKELFTPVFGNYFQMHRLGTLEEYKSFDITKDVETAWFDEMIANDVLELSIRNWDAVLHLLSVAKNYPDSKILEQVVAFASRHIMSSDSIVKLMYAENIIEIIKLVKLQSSTELLHQAYKAAAQILDDIILKPLIIDPGHELQLFDLKDKRSLNLRATKGIEAIKELLASD